MEKATFHARLLYLVGLITGSMSVELTEQATRDLLYFLEDLALDRQLAPAMVSEMVTAALRDHLNT